ncbi:PD-(D/E)XK nuclease family protein [Microbacterium fluvii]|uniref:DNA 3'-5' helicase n=1 Tax=Microbacterium fluvii TaxID=415215 RepID=A0ABW2HBA0_9MICO|nr:ATP-dependent DNA helicase [Microbacterium fluvii]MCU4672236.1 ATP-dependent helicase [Microbacterium fluvii]
MEDWDAAQRAVIELPHAASAVVVGAPGTGKTAVALERVRTLIAAGVDPDAIVVLTPSRQTATALRDRLSLTIARATSGAPARSIASFAFQLVRAGAVADGREPPQLLTGADEDQLIADLLAGDVEDEQSGESRWPEWLTPQIRATKGFRTEVRAFLAECTALGIPPAQLTQWGAQRDLAVWTALASFSSEYIQVRDDMRGAHRDAAGLVREAVAIVRAGLPGAQLLDEMAVLIVDDAQELTLGGVELVEACAARGVAVLALGDPDVGAGSFRGATPENFARLAAALGTPHVLSTAHRGSAAQVDLVRRLTQHIGAVGVVAHRQRPTGAQPDASVQALVARSAAEECDAIARLLRERRLHDGVPWGDLAVIAHDTRQVQTLEAELSARDVPARTAGPGSPLGVLAPARDLVRVVELAAADEWSADELSDLLVGSYGRLDAIGLRRLRSALRHAELSAGGERSGRELLVDAMRTPLELDLLDTREARRAGVLARTLHEVSRLLAEGATAHEVLWVVWERSGLERVWSDLAAGRGPLADQAGRDLDAVVALFQSAKRFVERTLDPDPRAFVRSILDSDVADDRLDAVLPDDAARILTPASALGVQFDTVVIAGLQDGVWPNTRLRGSLLETWRLADAAAGRDEPAALDRRRSAMHDELRLLVRAVSRASARVVMTAVDDDDTGPSVFAEFFPDPQAPTAEHPLSLRGLVAQHRRALTTGADAVFAAGQLALLADAAIPGAAPEQWYGVTAPSARGPLRDLEVADIRVSPSRLHALEECELNWVIADLGGDASNTSAGLGTIIHAALEHADGADEAALWAAVESRWGELSFESGWREEAQRATARDLVRRLHAYLRDFDRDGGTLIGAEPHFEVPVPLPGEPAHPHGVVLSGYIDRVELAPDGTVVIVDLKTGKREPQRDQGVVDNPQLAAYQLAFESGAIPEAAGHPPGGAKLLVLRPTSRVDYVTPRQPPFDDETRTAFHDRIAAAVEVMRGTTFAAPYEEHCRDEHSYGLCRIHTIGAVSAS